MSTERLSISKDEARILSAALREMGISDCFYKREDVRFVMKALAGLESKLRMFGKDRRRQGRTSMNDFSDCLMRYAKLKQKRNLQKEKNENS